MLDKTIRTFLSNIGKKGGKKTSSTYNMKEIGKLGGMKASANRKKREGFSTDEWKPYEAKAR